MRREDEDIDGLQPGSHIGSGRDKGAGVENAEFGSLVLERLKFRAAPDNQQVQAGKTGSESAESSDEERQAFLGAEDASNSKNCGSRGEGLGTLTMEREAVEVDSVVAQPDLGSGNAIVRDKMLTDCLAVCDNAMRQPVGEAEERMILSGDDVAEASLAGENDGDAMPAAGRHAKHDHREVEGVEQRNTMLANVQAKIPAGAPRLGSVKGVQGYFEDRHTGIAQSSRMEAGRIVAGDVGGEPRPVEVAGDFSDLPFRSAVSQGTREKQDGKRGGSGHARSWSVAGGK